MSLTFLLGDIIPFIPIFFKQGHFIFLLSLYFFHFSLSSSSVTLSFLVTCVVFSQSAEAAEPTMETNLPLAYVKFLN